MRGPTIIVPVEEYLRTSYDPDMDYVDGVLVERHVGERGHGRLQLLTGADLARREQGRFQGYTEQRIRVSAAEISRSRSMLNGSAVSA